MKYVNDNFIKYMGEIPKNKETLDQMMAEVDDFMSDFSDDYGVISRWGHYYFCDHDGGRLIFNHKQKGVHKCEVCGKNFESEILDGVWQYFYRNKAIVTSLVSALCFKASGDKKYLEYTKNILTYYADNYTKFPLHKKENDVYESYETMEWGCGRMMPQGLNESIVGIRVAQAYEIIRDDIDEDFKNKLFDWFNEMYRLLKPQVVAIHNISGWKDCAIGIMGLVSGNEEMVDFAFNGEFGLNNQIAKGVTPDRFWYEGSTHYNYFLLEGVCYLFLFAHLYDFKMDEKTKETIISMYVDGAKFTFDNGFFPNPNDGWPNLNLKTYSYQYHTMAKVLGEDSEIGNIVKAIENLDAPRTILPLSDAYYLNNETPVEKLLFNIDFDYNNYKPIERSAKNYPSSNYAILREGKLNVFLKYGLNAKSHAHPDIMNVEVMYGKTSISRDMSNAGYRARLCNEWHRKTLAHNTVVVDGLDMPSYEMGECISYSDNSVLAKAKTYEDVVYTRDIKITENTLVDTFTCESENTHTYDYTFHLENAFEIYPEYQMRSANLGFETNGYEHLSDINQVITDDEVIKFTAKSSDLTIMLEISAKDKEVYLLKSFDNPVSLKRSTILIRDKGENAKFEMKMDIKED